MLLFFMMFNLQAKEMNCQTLNGNKEFTIEPKFFHAKTIDYTIKNELLSYRFFIADASKPSEINDYLEIKDKNRSVIYALKCNLWYISIDISVLAQE